MNSSTKPIDTEKYNQVMQLLEEGCRICDISKVTGINRSSISNWKLRNGRHESLTHIYHPIDDADPRSAFVEMLGDFTEQDRIDYSYILGLYIGDGCIYALNRTFRLTITLDKKYNSLNEYTIETFLRFFNKPAYVFDRSLHNRGNALDIIHHSKKLPHFFPQHGRGRKHERHVQLTKWQYDLVDPLSIVKGLIMSDGSIYRESQSGNMKINFTNKSKDIIDIFEYYLNKLDIKFKTYIKHTGVYMTTIGTQLDVNRLIDLIGTKDSIK